MFAIVVRQFFGECTVGADISTGGIHLGDGLRLWAKLGMLLQDGGGHTKMSSIVREKPG